MINVLAVAVSIIYNSIVCCKLFHELNPIILFCRTYNSCRELEPTIVSSEPIHTETVQYYLNQKLKPETVLSETNRIIIKIII